MEDLLNYVVPALVAGFVVLAAGAYVFDSLPESAADAGVAEGLGDAAGPMPGAEPGAAGPSADANATMQAGD